VPIEIESKVQAEQQALQAKNEKLKRVDGRLDQRRRNLSQVADALIGKRRNVATHGILRSDLRAHCLQIPGCRTGLGMTGCEPNVHLLHLIEEGLLQMKAFPERLGLDSSKSLQDSDMARFNDHAQSAEDDDEQNDDENDRNESFKRGIHGM